jgi:hypothetical protein
MLKNGPDLPEWINTRVTPHSLWQPILYSRLYEILSLLPKFLSRTTIPLRFGGITVMARSNDSIKSTKGSVKWYAILILEKYCVHAKPSLTLCSLARRNIPPLQPVLPITKPWRSTEWDISCQIQRAPSMPLLPFKRMATPLRRTLNLQPKGVWRQSCWPSTTFLINPQQELLEKRRYQYPSQLCQQQKAHSESDHSKSGVKLTIIDQQWTFPTRRDPTPCRHLPVAFQKSE